jgi:hypothetical protein
MGCLGCMLFWGVVIVVGTFGLYAAANRKSNRSGGGFPSPPLTPPRLGTSIRHRATCEIERR